MSLSRNKSRAINRNVYLDNRLTTLTNLPIRFGNFNIEKDVYVGEDLDVSGNLTIGRDLKAKNYYSNNGNFYLDNYLLIPYGTIIQSAAVNIPDGWLVCNGGSILKVTYMNLFNAIGYTYGGSGNNFNVPDLQGRVIVGSGNGAGLSSRNLGNTGGEEQHTLTVNEIPSHSHTSNAVGGSVGLITANGSNTAIDVDSSSIEPNIYAAPVALTINATGSGNSHNVMQPFIVFHYLIKY